MWLSVTCKYARIRNGDRQLRQEWRSVKFYGDFQSARKIETLNVWQCVTINSRPLVKYYYGI